MAKRNPYSFPARSRKAMIAYVLDRKPYYESHYSRFDFAWNVKAHGVDWQNPTGEYTLDSNLDSAWENHLQSSSGDSVTEWAFEDAQSYYRKEWCSYPGDDQGEWIFGFYGRQGGHLCLESWRGYKFNGDDLESIFEGFSNDELRAFYRGIVCADSDFTYAKASANVEYQVNWIRGQWEEEKREEQERRDSAMAARMQEERPDMQPAWEGVA
jgi:hypothetical protein